MNLYERYEKLCQEPENATKLWYQKRGYEFEKLISDVLKRDGLFPHSSYKIKGEQIDGSFILGDRVYLLEAKWHKKEMTASDIYEFKGKVDGKLVGTIGIFVSISGFSTDSIDALTYGKEINIILFDQNDFEMGIKEKGAFKDILLAKIRIAAEVGSPYMRAKDILEINNKYNDVDKEVIIPIDDRNGIEKIVIICEGLTDEILLRIICDRVTKKSVTIIKANGLRNIPLLANSILIDNEYNKVILVADSDGDECRVNAMFRETVNFEYHDNWHSVIINDTIESWFDIEKSEYKGNRKNLLFQLEKRARENDIGEMRKKFPSFNQFYDLLTN